MEFDLIEETTILDVKQRSADFTDDLQQAGKRRRRGLLLRCRAVAMILVGIAAGIWVVPLVGEFIKDSGLDRLAVCSLIFLALPIYQAFMDWREGTQHLVPDAETLLRKDRRPPVVYLRAFDADDADPTPPSVPEILLDSGLDFDSAFGVSEEEQLARAMNEIGPFVAIGRPYDPLPKLGAARVRVSDEEWKSKVADWISRSALVVLRPGFSDGIAWEIEHIVERVPPEKFVLLLGGPKKGYERFRETMGGFFKKGLPDLQDDTAGLPARTLYGVVYFSPDWSPHLVQLTMPPTVKFLAGAGYTRRDIRVLAIPLYLLFAPRYWVTRLLKKALTPAVKQLGKRWKHFSVPACVRPIAVFMLLVTGVYAGVSYYNWRQIDLIKKQGYELQQRKAELEKNCPSSASTIERLRKEKPVLDMDGMEEINRDPNKQVKDWTDQKRRFDYDYELYVNRRSILLNEPRTQEPMTFTCWCAEQN